MKKHDKTLFQIGEIAKILGVTRKTLLVFEDMGLLTPPFKDPESGYRYYSADNMTQIRAATGGFKSWPFLSQAKERGRKPSLFCLAYTTQFDTMQRQVVVRCIR